MKSILSGVILIILLGSCKVIKKSGADADKYASYQEDLSESRISFPALDDQVKEESTEAFYEGSLAIDDDLDYAMRRFVEKNRSERYYSGYTVLVYSGVDRDAAFKTRNDLYRDFPEIKSEMQYQEPRYLVKVGKYINRIEAQANYNKLKESFPMTRIIQDRFVREGYENPNEKVDNDQREN
ncbi:hypothetical protein Belba_0811 [Belliella baltica DSM 15883]|uniref:Sporulation related protein n=1 Tax=Belliella baltica (strain DSM 15883 / CIP 108006 / LMG 21964 / BA134) TaxID=866536 RepID=I3Z2J1_BELBD|nr:hypothetical protein [Belliella baltica]AFL83459.1 hypothetical protein Belba_0811 [Belliella baltica DSM 15883]